MWDHKSLIPMTQFIDLYLYWLTKNICQTHLFVGMSYSNQSSHYHDYYYCYWLCLEQVDELCLGNCDEEIYEWMLCFSKQDLVWESHVNLLKANTGNSMCRALCVGRAQHPAVRSWTYWFFSWNVNFVIFKSHKLSILNDLFAICCNVIFFFVCDKTTCKLFYHVNISLAQFNLNLHQGSTLSNPPCYILLTITNSFKILFSSIIIAVSLFCFIKGLTSILKDSNITSICHLCYHFGQTPG